MLLDKLDDECVVLIEACSGQVITVGAIRDRAAQISQGQRKLVFLMADGTVESAWWFLALVEARHPVALIDAGNAWSITAGLINRYRPDLILDPSGMQIKELVSSPQGIQGELIQANVWLATECGPEPHEDLAVLLTTSGSTGSPKLVQLSSANIRTNAEQIVDSLGITADDRGVTALPLFYSFGMSVLTSHALAGSPVLVTAVSVLEESFWSDLILHGVSFLPGVPATYSMLKRLGFDQRDLPRLRALIQAGGRLAPELVSFFHDVMARQGGRFFVMYGQTEASPRISCLPSERLPEKLGSAGVPLAGGVLSIRGRDGSELAPGAIGEVIYRGPNVMMGYAESRQDLVLGAVQGAVLETGDLGYLDDEGFLYLTGRSKRICKLAGTRVSLDEIETIAIGIMGGDHQTAAVDRGDAGVALFSPGLDPPAVLGFRRGLARALRVPPKLVEVCPINAIPLLPNGKTDYAALERLLDAEGRAR
jgi:acyl-CoA synthetase (AMP-forming)/AMP-acid ligase II